MVVVIQSMMKYVLDDKEYNIVIERKSGNRNTYIRVKNDLTILVTTNKFTSLRDIERLLRDSEDKLDKMIRAQEVKKENNEGFNFLGNKYDIIYVNQGEVTLGEKKAFVNKNLDLDAWYKKQAKSLFLEHLNIIYNNFSRKIPYPDLKIRKMSTRWGVCNTKLKTVTLNLELIKRDTKYLDYVIVHELSHLIHANHSREFWALVEENMPQYKKYRKEMKDF